MSAEQNLSLPRFIRLLDYLFVLRPVLFFPGWSTVLAGYYGQSGSPFSGVVNRDPGWLLVAFGLAMGGSFLLNQICDRDSDRINKKLFLLADDHISPPAAWAEAILLLLLSLPAAFFYGLPVLIAVIVFILITGWVYNFRPFRWKNHPAGSVAANLLMGWLAFIIGWLAVRPFSREMIIFSLPYTFLNLALYFHTLLPDVAGDRQCGKKTIAVLSGEKPVIGLAVFLYLAGLLLALINHDWPAIIIFLAAGPFFIQQSIRRDITSTLRTTKFSAFIFALVIGLFWPIYYLMIVAAYFGTRWYFRRRFNLDYPNFNAK
jgi:4-hydroxybenzoate polyprenyltransferase